MKGIIENEIHYLPYVETLPFCSVVEVESGAAIIKEDPSDDMFLRCCEAAKATALISGDNHLLKLKSHRNTRILTPSRFLKQFHEQLRV